MRSSPSNKPNITLPSRLLDEILDEVGGTNVTPDELVTLLVQWYFTQPGIETGTAQFTIDGLKKHVGQRKHLLS